MQAVASYDKKFLEYTANSSRYAAEQIVPMLAAALAPKSVLDVGCANGTWLKSWMTHGCDTVHGVDGDYVDTSQLEIPPSAFTAADLTKPLELGRRFDLVQSLEVGEHIEAGATDLFVDSIARHANRYVVFSAAPPGQGGEHHVNEQTYEFWREKWSSRGFAVFDFVRPLTRDDVQISYWYRYNIFLFVRHEYAAKLSSHVAQSAIDPSTPLSDISPLTFRLRKEVVRRLPRSAQAQIARLKARLLPTGRF